MCTLYIQSKILSVRVCFSQGFVVRPFALYCVSFIVFLLMNGWPSTMVYTCSPKALNGVCSLPPQNILRTLFKMCLPSPKPPTCKSKKVSKCFQGWEGCYLFGTFLIGSLTFKLRLGCFKDKLFQKIRNHYILFYFPLKIKISGGSNFIKK